MKKYKLGIFLEGGGIRTFYSGGVLSGFRKNKIMADYVVGISASAGIIFGYIFNCNKGILDIFNKKCKANKKNFYFFRREHFLHNRMMEDSLREIFSKYIKDPNNKNISYTLIAAKTGKSLVYLKNISVLVLMVLKNIFRLNLFRFFRELFHVTESRLSSSDSPSKGEVVNFIMGSSSMYPFIKPHFVKDGLLMEVNVLDIEYKKLLKNCDKGIIIYTSKGKTRIEDKILHVHPSCRLPFNIVDYSSKNNFKRLTKLGEVEAEKNLGIIKDFLRGKIKK